MYLSELPMLVSNFFFRVIYVEYMSFGSSQIVAPKKMEDDNNKQVWKFESRAVFQRIRFFYSNNFDKGVVRLST